MTKPAALTLASTLTLAQLSEDRLAPFYDEAIYALGALPYLFTLSLATHDLLALGVFPALPGDIAPYRTTAGEAVFFALPGDIYPFRTESGVGVIFALPGNPLGAPLQTVDDDFFQHPERFPFPDDALVLHEVWYEDRALDAMTHDELTALAVQWQAHSGPPIAFSVENLSLREFQLYPAPTIPSDPLLMLHFGGAFGIDYPSGNAVVLATRFLLDIPSWLELPLIYGMLSREYALESDHQDLDFAQGCAHVAALLFSMLPMASIH